MKFFKKAMPFALGLIVMAGSVFAQGQQQQQQQVTSEDVSKQELKNFVATASAVRGIQREAQTKLQQIVQDEGLKFQRFQLIMMSKQNPQVADSVKMTPEEQKALSAIQPKMQKMNQQIMQKFQTAIKDNGLTQQRFQQIAQALQTDTTLQQRFKKLQAQQMQSEGEDGNS